VIIAWLYWNSTELNWQWWQSVNGRVISFIVSELWIVMEYGSWNECCCCLLFCITTVWHMILLLYSMLIVYMLSTGFRQRRASMGAVCSSYFQSSDIVHAEAIPGVPQTERVECDNMLTDGITATADSRPNVDLVSATSVDISHCANKISSSISPAMAAVTSSHGKGEHHHPWLFANMTEEHWERLNMMCIVSPSSS